jgi:hypothetical protein
MAAQSSSAGIRAFLAALENQAVLKTRRDLAADSTIQDIVAPGATLAIDSEQ